MLWINRAVHTILSEILLTNLTVWERIWYVLLELRCQHVQRDSESSSVSGSNCSVMVRKFSMNRSLHCAWWKNKPSSDAVDSLGECTSVPSSAGKQASKSFWAVLLVRSQSGKTKRMVVFEICATKDSDFSWNEFRIRNACSKKDTGAGTFRLRKLVQRWTLVSIQANLSRDCCYPIGRVLQILNTHRQFVVVFVFGFVTLRLWVVLSWSQCCE